MPTGTPTPIVGGDEWNTRCRDEEPMQRADRNFAELLQELRVLATSVQILFGFLLTLALSARFDGLDTTQRWVFTATLTFAALSSTLLIAPVATHRLLFQRGHKRELVRAGHRMAVAGMAFLALTLSAGLLLVLDVALGRWPAMIMTGGLFAVTSALWVEVPLRLRRCSRPVQAQPTGR